MLRAQASLSRGTRFRTRPSQVRTVLALASLLLLAACPEPGPVGPISLELGTGASFGDFVPIADGGEVSMSYGPQGGQHVWVALRSKEIAYGSAHVQVSLTDADTGEELTHTIDLRTSFIARSADGFLLVSGLRLFIDDPSKVLDRRARMEARVVDARGNEGVDARTVTVRW